MGGGGSQPVQSLYIRAIEKAETPVAYSSKSARHDQNKINSEEDQHQKGKGTETGSNHNYFLSICINRVSLLFNKNLLIIVITVFVANLG